MLLFCPACYSCLTQHKIHVLHEFLKLFKETGHIDNITKPIVVRSGSSYAQPGIFYHLLWTV